MAWMEYLLAEYFAENPTATDSRVHARDLKVARE